MMASLPFIVKLINDELGIENLIEVSDITYCRYFFKDAPFSKHKSKLKKENLIIPKNGNPQNIEIKFTDPDLNIYDKSIKSKFSKQ